MAAIVLASGNYGKIREIQAILEHDELLAQAEFNVPEPEETGSTFIENAIIKARNAARYCKLPAIADDSGLVVDALAGAPGVISARYAGFGASDQANLDKLLRAMQDIPSQQRSARFVCIMVYLRHADDPLPIIAEGIWEGQILMQPIGEQGFGYDPVFWVEEHQCSSAQLAPEVKNRLSHRGQAVRMLKHQLLGR